jgi:UDP-galactose transporter B1
MARSKQAPPIRREASSEYFSRKSSFQGSGDSAKQSNGKVAAPAPRAEAKEAGVLQLLIAVAGIYASL